MRRAAVIAGVLILTTAFAAAWFVLGPSAAEHDAAPMQDSIAGKRCGAPLEAGDREVPGSANQSGGGALEGEPASVRPPRPGELRAGETAAPRPADTTAGGAPTPRPGDTTAGRLPAPQDEATAGEEPAPLADQPFIKGHDRPPGQNLGNTRPGARVIAKPTGVKSLDEVSAKLTQDRRGLYAEYFALGDDGLADLDTSSPDMVRIDRQVYFPDGEAFSDLPFTLDNFAAAWTGFLVVPEQGDYWLFWGADNGGRVELDGETVLLQDGMVRYVEVSAVLTLAPGLHPLKIEFAQTHNAVADWAKCAANFMWVPQGQTKPVPVPPEMLMVPDWMWSDNAPIIISLSKSEGEIGDEITIHGQALEEEKEDAGWFETSVFFAGQIAQILEASPSALRVRVPIGARTGDVVVYQRPTLGLTDMPNLKKLFSPDRMHGAIPSNSASFTVTTQFGLMAEWHNLEGWSNFDFVDGSTHAPDLVRLESDFAFASRIDLELPYRDQPFAGKWAGNVGIPANWVTGDYEAFVEFQARGKLRVSLGEDTKESESGTDNGDTLQTLRFHVAEGEERYLSLLIEMADWEGSAALRVVKVIDYGEPYHEADREEGVQYEQDAGELPTHWFFPPIAPPAPPVIANVKALLAEGETYPASVYDLDPARPTIHVGQEFEFTVTVTGGPEVHDLDLDITIDGIAVPWSRFVPPPNDAGVAINELRGVLPSGAAEGRLIARTGITSSEPVFIDIANRGLVAYLYDVPDAGGLAKLPDLGPLTCFKVRKDRVINFESAASFDLPFPAGTFVIEWLGGLIIEEDADYTFTCRSDDGMKLWLDDNVVLDADKLQAPAENSATVHLVPGTYRFRMQFFENNQHEVCVLEWAANRDGQAVIPREVIPARAFTLDTHPPFPDKTSTGKRTDGS